MTFANGHTEVLYISLISNLVGSNLFPVPIHEMIGTFCSFALCINFSFVETVSTESTT